MGEQNNKGGNITVAASLLFPRKSQVIKPFPSKRTRLKIQALDLFGLFKFTAGSRVFCQRTLFLPYFFASPSVRWTSPCRFSEQKVEETNLWLLPSY
jgi:hypothetical protein